MSADQPDPPIAERLTRVRSLLGLALPVAMAAPVAATLPWSQPEPVAEPPIEFPPDEVEPTSLSAPLSVLPNSSVAPESPRGLVPQRAAPPVERQAESPANQQPSLRQQATLDTISIVAETLAQLPDAPVMPDVTRPDLTPESPQLEGVDQPIAVRPANGIEQATAFTPRLVPDLVTIAIPGRSRQHDQLPTPALSGESLPISPAMRPNPEPVDASQAVKDQQPLVPLLPSQPQVVHQAIEQEAAAQPMARPAPLDGQPRALHRTGEPAPTSPVNTRLLSEAESYSPMASPALRPPVSHVPPLALPAVNPSTALDRQPDAAVHAQIEQLRRTVEGLQAKLATQPASGDPAPAPVPPPQPPVIIRRSVPPLSTPAAFWARRHLGHSHLRRLR